MIDSWEYVKSERERREREASTGRTDRCAYYAADGTRRHRPAFLVRAVGTAGVWRGLGGTIQHLDIPAGTELWAPTHQRLHSLPADPAELFGVIVQHCGRPCYFAAQSTAWEMARD